MLKGGRVINPGKNFDEICDILVEDGKIAAIGKKLSQVVAACLPPIPARKNTIPVSKRIATTFLSFLEKSLGTAKQARIALLSVETV